MNRDEATDEAYAKYVATQPYVRYAEAAPPEGEPVHDIDWSELNRQLSGGGF